MAKDPPERRTLFNVLFGRCSELKEVIHLLHDLRRIAMATQQDVEQLKTDLAATKVSLDNLSGDVTSLNTSIQALNTRIAELEVNANLDLTEVKAMSAAVATQAAEIAARTPEPTT